ncbi:MAG: hypothetical protein P4L80_12105 [Xanthobacteraceae bacterium]|nr:hypothetical protein [Xanthobacteraceae bacterium]
MRAADFVAIEAKLASRKASAALVPSSGRKWRSLRHFNPVPLLNELNPLHHQFGAGELVQIAAVQVFGDRHHPGAVVVCIDDLPRQLETTHDRPKRRRRPNA